LSSYISDPGSTRQVIHADTPCFGKERDRQPILCTCFLALQDVRLDMGPTLFLPQTNTYAMHALFFGEEDSGATSTPVKDHFLQTHPSVLGMLPKGSCVLFDSRLLHCGTANTSVEDSRALFFFSFQHPGITLSNPGGDTASIRSDVKGRFRLSDFVKVGT
jgi:ectoine hydroxylase-related dioxygenase (phytanoyl-CoA dioxygenase family)